MTNAEGHPLPNYEAIEQRRGKEYALGFQSVKTGDLKAADEHYGKAIKENPSDPELYDTYLRRAMVRIDLKEYRGALADLDEVLSLADERKLGNNLVSVYYTRALAYEGLGDGDKELKALKMALKTDPQHAFSHFKLAQYYEKRGNKELALKEYRMSKELMKNWTIFLESKKIIDDKIKELAGR